MSETFCTKCGTKKSEGKFCSGCSDLVAITCPTCFYVFPYAKKTKYCFNCGTEFGEITLQWQEKNEFFLRYKATIKLIMEYVDEANKWVSYQDLAEFLGLKSCLDLLDPLDENSSIAQIIYRGRIRQQGYETIAYNFKNDQGRYRIVRFIKRKEIILDTPDEIIASMVLSKIYSDVSIVNLIDVSHLG